MSDGNLKGKYWLTMTWKLRKISNYYSLEKGQPTWNYYIIFLSLWHSHFYNKSLILLPFHVYRRLRNTQAKSNRDLNNLLLSGQQTFSTHRLILLVLVVSFITVNITAMKIPAVQRNCLCKWRYWNKWLEGQILKRYCEITGSRLTTIMHMQSKHSILRHILMPF